MIPSEVIKKIKKIHIKSHRAVSSVMAGQYKSIFKGSGIEFEEVRHYSFGDDAKSIDWKVSARFGKPFIKLYREERESIVILLIDMSSSSFFGTKENSKLETSMEAASILAFNAIKNNDKVGALFFTDKVEKFIPPKKGSAHIWRLIKEFFTFSPQNKQTNIELALKHLRKLCRKRALVFLISDFLDHNYLKPLKIASKKYEIISLLLSDEKEFMLPNGGIFVFKDLETNKEILLDTFDKQTIERYFNYKSEEYQSVKSNLKSAGIDCIEIKNDSIVSDELLKYFKIREKRKR